MPRSVVPARVRGRRRPYGALVAATLAAALGVSACATSTAAPGAAPTASPSAAASTTSGSTKSLVGGVTGAKTAPTVKQVVFIGDSITGGYGYFADNYPVLDTVKDAGGCTQNPPPDDRCTNSQPGAGPTPYDSTVTPWVAYPYQFGQLIASENAAKKTPVKVYNYAVSGATPAMWDPTVKPPAANLSPTGTTINPGPGGCAAANTRPDAMDTLDASDAKYAGCDPNLYPGLFGTNNYPSLQSWNLTKLQDNTLTVMTLGANPLLSRMMYLYYIYDGVNGADNACAQKDTATFLKCVQQDLTIFRQKQHLTNVLSYAAKRGPVLLELVYHTCPGTFGNTTTSWKPVTSANAGCKGTLQQQNAYAAIDLMNNVMREAVADVKKADPEAQVAAICPGNVSTLGVCGGPGTFDDHQATETQQVFNSEDFPETNPWVLSTDTGIHPTASGHRFLAEGVLAGACQNFGLWCQTARADNVTNYWTNVSDSKKCRSTYLCTFVAVKNNTSKTWTLATLSQPSVTNGSGDPLFAKNGEFVLYPPNSVRPGETARFMVESRHSGPTSWGAEAVATYRMSGGGRVTIDAEVGNVYNTWGLSATGGVPAKILDNISQKRGSDMILNGIVG